MVKLGKDRFLQRMKRVYEYWKEDDGKLAGIDGVVMAFNATKEGVAYSPSRALQGGENDAEVFKQIVEKIKAIKDSPSMGDAVKEKEDGKFVTALRAALADAKIEMQEVQAAFSVLTAVKDQEEIDCVKQACTVCCNVWNKAGGVRKRLVEIIDKESKIRHEKFSNEIELDITDNKFVAPIDKSLIESCYTPIVQSGGNYNLKVSALSDNKHMHFASICTSLGAKYKDYCANLSRTMMLVPDESVEKAYEVLVAAEQAVIDALRPGTPISEAFEAGVRVIREKNSALASKLTKNFGFGTGLMFRDGNLLISPKTTEKVRQNMTFVIHMGLTDLDNPNNKDEAGKTVALLVSDTVLVGEESTECLTDAAKKKLKSISIRYIQDEDETTEVDNNKENIDESLGRGKRSVVLHDQTRKKATDDKRKENQKRLSMALNERAKERLANKTGTKDEVKVKKSTSAYKAISSLPDEEEVKKCQVFVDRRHEAVILPIFGIPVPFHISMIKNVSTSVEGDFTYLRINLTHPGAALGSKDASNYPQPLATFLKELTYRSTNLKEPGEISAPSSNLNTAFRMIKDLQKRFRTREAEEREKEGTVKQDKLMLSQNKGNPRLKDLYVRPNIVSKRISGTLEAHLNGFRYTSLRGDKIDVLFNNIRHSFFQPCDNEMLILLHFHLKQPVLFGKKKYSDIQFYAEVGELHTDLGKYHHMQDRDDIYAEQAERELRHKLNQSFKQFCEKVERLTNQKVEFDSPFRELGFTGVPFRSAVRLMPTSSCLVSLSEWPPFVVTLDDIELVHFERVHFSIKNFDMVFVFKDYAQKPYMVQQIQIDQLEGIKDWLNECDIRFSEGVQSLNWPKIMKTINDDPEQFLVDGGWNFLAGDGESDVEAEEEDSDAGDDEYKDSEGEESDAESSGEDEESGEETESDESDASLESDESSGKDWSDLEEDARKADRDHADLSDEERRPSKKRKPSPQKRKGPPPPKRRK